MKNINKNLKKRSFTRIHFVRHGEVDNPNHILYGRLPKFSLSEKGFGMSEILGDYILKDMKDEIEKETQCKDFSVYEILSSPLLRTKETAKYLAEKVKKEIIPKGELIEVEYYFEGEKWGKFKNFLNPKILKYLYNPFKPSWSEPFNEINNRVKSLVIDKVKENKGHDTFMFSHKTVISTAIRYFSGKSLFHIIEHCDLASIHTLHFDENNRFLGVEYRNSMYKDLK